jgi:hypothetical protein
MSQLDIYIDQACLGCNYAKDLASEVQQFFPEIEVRIFDLSRPDIKKPDTVFAVPTYIFNGKDIWLGNPEKDALFIQLRESLI